MQTLTMKLGGMSCGHCVGAVTRALKSVAGVEVTDVKVGSATVNFDPVMVTRDQITAAVTDEGYQVVEAA
jgi:copper chaperone